MTEYCPICDAMAALVREDGELKLGRRSALVEHELYKCPECGERWYTPEQMDRVQSAAAATIREEEGLLSPAEIRHIRDHLELSQADFEKLLGFGPKTVGRWERGTVLPNQSSDILLRVVREYPEVVRFLAARHEVEIPAEGDWSGGSTKQLKASGITEVRSFRSKQSVPDLSEVFRPTHSGFMPAFIMVTAEERSSVS